MKTRRLKRVWPAEKKKRRTKQIEKMFFSTFQDRKNISATLAEAAARKGSFVGES